MHAIQMCNQSIAITQSDPLPLPISTPLRREGARGLRELVEAG